MKKPTFLPKFLLKFNAALACICLLLAVCGDGYAQKKDINSLIKKLQTNLPDTTRVSTYYSLSKLYWSKNTDTALYYVRQSLNLAQKIHFEQGIALANLSKGVIMDAKGRFPEALACHLECLRISEKLKMTGLSSNAYSNIAGVYLQMEDYKNARIFFQKAYDIIAKQTNPPPAAIYRSLINIGETFKYTNHPDSAIVYNQRALKIAQTTDDTMTISIAMYNIGENSVTIKNYALAKNSLINALDLSVKINDRAGIAYCNSTLALLYYYLQQYQQSLAYAQRALEFNKEIGAYDIAWKTYHVLYLTHEKLGDYEKALYYRNLEVKLKEEQNGIEKTKIANKLQSAYELEKQKQQITFLKKEKQFKQQELDNITYKRNLFAIGTLVLLCLIGFLIRGYFSKQKLIQRLEQQNNDIIEKNQHLEELIVVRNRLFSIIGHDLRGPIHSIKAMIELLNTEEIDEEEKKFFIENASQSLNVTANLTDNLLYWAKSQMDGIKTVPTHFDIYKVIRQNIQLIEKRAFSKEITVKAAGNGEALMVFADENMIDIVLRNLIENAVKFLKSSKNITIKVDIDTTQRYAIISVQDNGDGISVEAQHKIFNKYTSYSTYGTAKEKGSGLGLLLCKELVEKNQGNIWFESEPMKGTTFFFSIPLA